ncbi:hypothetical protein PBY51_016356 [Eleginops maclovinus]|uniref:Uncharacterized protein n=1 Tax=Eleginops maclovinus TaxID=56733 RepID=A0AAN8AQS8_ELEMC|nr:hypothetical protein PBY51_016356 [Eleginops maclovinus]
MKTLTTNVSFLHSPVKRVQSAAGKQSLTVFPSLHPHRGLTLTDGLSFLSTLSLLPTAAPPLTGMRVRPLFTAAAAADARCVCLAPRCKARSAGPGGGEQLLSVLMNGRMHGDVLPFSSSLWSL